MGYVTNGLTFNALRGANQARLPEFKDKHGRIAHAKPDGSDWTPAQWLQAVIGELGEYANVRKKFERGDLTWAEFQALAAKELADVQTYLDILALRCLDQTDRTNGATIAHPTGIDLGQATIDKFNEVSERVSSSVRLEADDWHRVPVKAARSAWQCVLCKTEYFERPVSGLCDDCPGDVVSVAAVLNAKAA